MADAVLNWLRKDPTVYTVMVNVTTTPTLVMGAGVQRYALMITGSATNYIAVTLSETTPVNPHWTIQSAGPTMILTEDDVGGFIREPVWVWGGAAMPNRPLVSLSYNPRAWQAYRKMMDEYVSRFQPS